ncbi:MAG: aminoacetone oxidase family FAD-binding enzyme [Firmicutes bacterium]|nr:aminoacetone oxidase family FAD-binding enzyme [Bacillota bacterium]
MIYDIIIIGAGASGLFAASNIKLKKNQHGLILDKAKKPGLKLLMAGSGQCNLTHAGDIKEFVTHYGPSGKKIRSIIYNFSNDMLKTWFTDRGLKLMTRDDGKVFPETMYSRTVLDLFLKESSRNCFELRQSHDVVDITQLSDNNSDSVTSDKTTDTIAQSIDSSVKDSLFRITVATASGKETYITKKVIVATGGCSYPATGSDGAIFSVLTALDLELIPCKPALVPLSVEGYPYAELSGNSVKQAQVWIYEGKHRKKNSPTMRGDVLMTHRDFSGPGIIDMSRYAKNGYTLEINWVPEKNPETILSDINTMRKGNKKQLISVLTEYFPTLTQAHLRWLCQRAETDPAIRFTDVNSDKLKTLIRFITSDTFTISGTQGYKVAMATAGGIALSEISTSTMECKRIPGLYILGEALDVDGDTGGYNLQFAFSSAMRAAAHISDEI